jgi:type II secretory pathway pseudopilin PulG
MKKYQFSHQALLAGFSLVEMAMVLLITGILLSGLMVSLGQSTNNARRTTATNQLKIVQEALYGFAQANGRLPCPATNASDGREAVVTVTDGDCTAFHGFVPSVTLGLSGNVNNPTELLLLDAWQNPLRYSVASYDTDLGAGTKIAFTSQTGLSSMFIDSGLLTGNMLTVCDDPADCAATAISDTSPAVIFSMGDNWATYTSADEQANSGNGVADLLGVYRVHPSTNDNFVSTEYNEASFDDIIIWLSPYTLYNRMISAGQLP